MKKNTMQRLQILGILYHHMEQAPKAPWVHINQLTELGEIDFSIEVLKELQHIKQNGFNYRIQAGGILAYEQTQQAKP